MALDGFAKTVTNQRDAGALAAPLGQHKTVLEIQRLPRPKGRVREEIDGVADDLTVDFGEQRPEARWITDGIGRQACACAGVGSGELLVICETVDQFEQARHVVRGERAKQGAHVYDS